MGSPAPHPSPVVISDASASTSPEVLARVILRCRELGTFLDKALPLLPGRGETPFLYGQLDEALKRLQASLRPLVAEELAQSEKGGLLRRLAGKKAREAPKKSETRYDLEGNSWTIPVTELVGFLSHSGKSGLLWITSPAETFVLEFARGSLVHATSNAQPVAYRLGEILLEQKLIEQAELTRLIDAAKSADDMLGSYLVRSGRLRHEDLQRALAVQVQQLFHRLMDAENALYRFQEGAQLLRSYGLEVNITQLLLESARKKDEARQRSEQPRSEDDEFDEPEPEPASALPSLDLDDSEAEESRSGAAPGSPASGRASPSPASRDA